MWRIGTSDYRQFTSPGGRHHFQFLQLADQLMLWFGGAASSVLDLTTGDAFDVNGSVAASPERIAIAQQALGPAAKDQFKASHVTSIGTRVAPPIDECR